jgi:pimeloyl-ACP methyl ester carboxylesterase
MKTLAKAFKVTRWLGAILIILFSISTFLWKSYGQTICLVLIATTLVYWPKVFTQNLKKPVSIGIRILSIIFLIAIKQLVFKSDPKTSIYISEKDKQELMTEYDKCMQAWPENTTEHYVQTKYGKVHFLECGNPSKPAIVMFHAASMGAHSWAENLEPLLDNYHIYSFDNPGEGNKSELDDALVYPSNPKKLAELYKYLLDKLQIDSAIVFGASNGGFIAQNLAYFYPEKVTMLALFGPMGLTQLTKGSVGMMMLSTMYPLQVFRDAVANWAIGTAPVCHEKYGDWFNLVMKGTIPSITHPIPMTTEQKKSMNIPVLLFLGSKDRIVGNAQTAKKMAEDYPDIQLEILESGHLIAVEHSEEINKRIEAFLE